MHTYKTYDAYMDTLSVKLDVLEMIFLLIPTLCVPVLLVCSHYFYSYWEGPLHS